MATHNLAVILKNPFNDSQFLLLKQTPPPKFGEDEYDSYVDSHLWDLPSTLLNLHENASHPGILIQGEESFSDKIDMTKFDVELGLNRVLEQVGFKEYPPGVILVPMQSRTAKPFHTTNLVIFAPENVSDTSGDYSFVAYGDALIVDPGCRHEYHEEATGLLAIPRFLETKTFGLVVKD
ncbi:hypothetical protein QQP08_008469 [Theobroma cacao]|nr:hypothetical protein QQP08_008469 [Theobroma cacao]